LEGFVLAITPFNFTSIGGNLPTAPALCGNTVVWKPADTQIYSAQVFMRILKKAGLPDGVINLIYVEGEDLGDVCFRHPDLAGLHFTGSTQVFQHLWKTMGEHIATYKTYPRIVGETGGKDFVLVHPSADASAVVANLLRGAFEFQGQKCSAASRAYLPKSLAETIVQGLVQEMATLKMGTPEDFSHFINAVIDQKAFTKINAYIDKARHSPDARIVAGGTCDPSKGFFIEPTLIEAFDPNFITMREEIFGPVLTYYVFEDADFDQVIHVVDQTSNYALTGALFAQDRVVIDQVTRKLEHNAGNFYINDKPTGAVVGQQPFGGARASGTNDKAGSPVNLYRWLSMRTIKETYVPATDYRYPFLGES
jgi:1-pyrroline-5-carboxylate dehydrogenase